MSIHFPRSRRRFLPCFILALLALLIGAFVHTTGAATPATPAGAATATATTKAATGTAPAEEEEDKTKYDVHVGVYINQFKSIDIKTNTFVVDFWIWFRWKGDNLKPLESFEIVGGSIDSKEHESTKVVEGFNYSQVRVTATVTKFFDIARFPLDSHTLSLDIEDSDREEDQLVFIPDRENSNLSEDLRVPGWSINSKRAVVGSHTYATNYGDISLKTGAESNWSRFSYQVDLVRPGAGYFFKLFWSLFLATVIALLAMLIDPIDLDPRFGLGVGAIFAAIASAYVISSALPETNQYTLADKMNMLAVGVIFLSICQSVWSLHLWKTGKEAASKLLDRVCFWGMLVLYGGVSLLIVIL